VDFDDTWLNIRGFVDAFNENREYTIIPGPYLTVDESMSMWLGRSEKYAVEGHPHIIKIMRKPRGIGTEFKNVCDGQSGIMLRLEIN
jgi:hypothetical protein